MALRAADDPELYARIEERNLLRQYDLLSSCIEIGLVKGIDALDKYTLWSLNAAAATNISQFGGRFRCEPIYVGAHVPPPFVQVSELMDRCLSVVHENWDVFDHPTLMAAYFVWRMLWIHPFIEGNGRTARAACYYLICLKQGRLLEGNRSVAERIRDAREPYYAALRAADRAWAEGHFDVSELADYLLKLLTDQIENRE